jgi:hypothetical protein
VTRAGLAGPQLLHLRASSPILPLDCPGIEDRLATRRIQPFGGIPKITRTDDVVSLEHAPGLVSGHLHRHPLGNAGADEIADRGPAEVVQDAPGTPGCRTGRPECDAEALDRPARAVEDARANDLQLPLEILGDRSLLFKQFILTAASRIIASSTIAYRR